MAVINITPLTDITALIASDSVNEGDVILLEEGTYFQTVLIPKNNIRLVAKGPKVIFDGRSTLVAAFILTNVTGVAIEGMHIKHYRVTGIEIDGGSGNRLIKNKISNILNIGILISDSGRNLIWNNEISRCGDGILLISEGSSNNWIIDNTVKECYDDGFEAVSATLSSNAFIANKAIKNRFTGFDIFGNNNLFLNNTSTDNNQGMLLNAGSSSVAIGNEIKGSKVDGYVVNFGYINHFAGENRSECNRLAGIFDQGENGMFLNNEVSYNSNSGFFLVSTGSLIKDNKLICNIPQNINDIGSDNSLINNKEKPCEPCESPGEVCDTCFDKKADNPDCLKGRCE